MIYGDSTKYTGDGLVSLDGVYCFSWPDTGTISSPVYYDCASIGKTSIAMSIERFNEFLAASELASGKGETPGTGTGTSTGQNSFPLLNLTLEQAEQLGWLSLAPMLTAYIMRKFRDVLN